MIRDHLRGIVNAITLRASNGPAEGLQQPDQDRQGAGSRGFRNRKRFANASTSESEASTSTPIAFPFVISRPTQKR